MQRFITNEVKVKKISGKYFVESFKYNLYNNITEYISCLFDVADFNCFKQLGFIQVFSFHNENGPAVIKYHVNGNKFLEEYWINGVRHNEKDAAVIKYYENGKALYKYYYINNLSHRTDGPAYIEYNNNGRVKFKSYWLNDEEVDVKSTKELKKYILLNNIK